MGFKLAWHNLALLWFVQSHEVCALVSGLGGSADWSDCGLTGSARTGLWVCCYCGFSLPALRDISALCGEPQL